MSRSPRPVARRLRRSVPPVGTILCLVLACLLLSHPDRAWGGAFDALLEGDLTESERRFLQYAIFDLKDVDLVRTWIDARIKKCRDRRSKGDLEYAWADTIRISGVDGAFDEFAARTQVLAQKYPQHPRSGGAKLDAIRAKMASVLEFTVEARIENDAQKRAELRRQREQVFQQDVVSALETRIDQLNRAVTGTPEPQMSDLRQRIDWEHYQITAWMLYARDFAEGTPEAQQAYERVLELATSFVDDRDQSLGFGHVCDAQLQKGRALAALGRPGEAAEAFEILVEISPPFDGPYAPELIRAIVQLRVQALQGTAEAYNRSGEPDKSVEIFDLVYSTDDPYINLSRARQDPSLIPVFMSVDVEEAISRAAGEDPYKGLSILNRLLNRVNEIRRQDPQTAQDFEQEVAVGLSRLIDIGAGGLTAEYYYRAGRGYKSRGLYGEAILTWKRALDAAGDPGVNAPWAARSLFEIAETSFILDRIEESALGFLLYLEAYPNAQRRGKAAKNAYSMLVELDEAHGDPWSELVTRAEQLFSEAGEGVGAEQLKLTNAAEAEIQGLPERAREGYLKIQKTVSSNGTSAPVEFYFKARSGAARCLFKVGRGNGNTNGERAKAIKELEQLDTEARNDGNADGRAVVLYELASIYWDEAERDTDKTLAVLAPLATEIRGNDEAREKGLYLWVNALVAANRIDEAEAKLAILQRDFKDSVSTARGLLDLIDAHQSQKEDATRHLKRAGELAETYTAHTTFKMDEEAIPVLRWLADAMIRGGNPNGALPVLNAAKAKLGNTSNAEERIGVLFSFARAANAAGQPARALQILDELLKQFPEMRQGLISDAPYVYMELAKAKLLLNESKPDRTLLQDAEKNFEIAIAILQQRRRFLRSERITIPETEERDYWWAYLHYLKTRFALQKWEQVAKEIQTIRYQSQDEKKFAPPDLQREFDDLEKQCEGKK